MADGDAQSIFEATQGSTDIDKLMAAKLKAAAGQTNQPSQGGLFQNSPYSQYQVYLGGGAYQGSTFTRTYTPYSEAILDVTHWDDDQLRQFVNKGIVNKVPGFEVGMGLPQIQSAWQNMVEASILFNQSLKDNQTPWTPYDVMDTWANQKGKFGTQRQGDWIFDVATGERIKYVGPKSRTTTHKNVDLSSPEDVKALASQMLSELLGRAPTAKELAQFRASINAQEKASPEVTTVTQQLSPDLATGEVRVADESSTTSGGVSDAARAALIQSPVQDTKEYGKYQAGTTYFDAMMQMIGGG